MILRPVESGQEKFEMTTRPSGQNPFLTPNNSIQDAAPALLSRKMETNILFACNAC